MRQVSFCTFAPTPGKVVEADPPALEFVETFANGFTVPPSFAFGTALAARPKLFHDLGHKPAARMPLQRLSSFNEQQFERVGHIHSASSRLVKPRAMLPSMGWFIFRESPSIWWPPRPPGHGCGPPIIRCWNAGRAPASTQPSMA